MVALQTDAQVNKTIANFNLQNPLSVLGDPAKTGPSAFMLRNIINSAAFREGVTGRAPLPKVFEGGFSKEVLAGAKTFGDIKQAELIAKKKANTLLSKFLGVGRLAAMSLPFANLAAGGLGTALGTIGGSAATSVSQLPGVFASAAQGFGGAFGDTFTNAFGPSQLGSGAPVTFKGLTAAQEAQLAGPGVSFQNTFGGPAVSGAATGAIGFTGDDFASLGPEINTQLTQAGITPQILTQAGQALEAGGGLSLEKLAPLVGASGPLSLTSQEFASLSQAAAAAGKSSVGIFDLLQTVVKNAGGLGNLASGVGGLVSGGLSLAGSTPKATGATIGSLTSPSFGVQFGSFPILSRIGGEDPAAIEQAQRARLGELGAGFEELQGQIPGLQQQLLGQPFGDIQASSQRLQQQVAATREELGGQFNKVREARLEALGDVRDRSIGNLRDTLRNRRVFGANFANADIERAELGFAQEEQRVISESAIQEATIRGDFDRLAGQLLELDQRTLLQQTQNIAIQAGLNEQEAGLLGQRMATIQAEQASLSQTLTREFNELAIPGNLANNVAAIVADVGKFNAGQELKVSIGKGEAIEQIAAGLGSIFG